MPQHVKKLLIANRGEIATRIITTARALSIETYAVYTTDDDSHTLLADCAIQIPNAASYLDIDTFVKLAKQHSIDHVHPGYGFLSESADFAKRMLDEAGAIVIGPGSEVLQRTGDKLQARILAEECNVPVLPALTTPTREFHEVERFAASAGYPIMIKAVDGGGGRGIRIARDAQALKDAVKRAVEESPSRLVFAERAAVDGFRHVEVQIVGDGVEVRHVWERECSIQRRYQKVVEIAPSTISDRQLVTRVIQGAVKMADRVRFLLLRFTSPVAHTNVQQIKYKSLGTFEFLVNPRTKEYFFLEINPRIQVEHTITESITQLDLVQIQLQLANGLKLSQTDLSSLPTDPSTPPPHHSIQLRLTAENPSAQWTLSVGKIAHFHFPSGNGLRTDTHLIHGHPTIVSTDFDSLLAKIIITSRSWHDTIAKAARALQDTHISGVRTNIDVLRGIIASEAFRTGSCDTTWLEPALPDLLQSGTRLAKQREKAPFAALTRRSAESSMPTFSSSSMILRKGDAWTVDITPITSSSSSSSSSSQDAKEAQAQKHQIRLLKVHRNDLPTSLTADLTYTLPSASLPFHVKLTSTGPSSSGTADSSLRKADSSNASHVPIPFAGRLVEVLVAVGDVIPAGKAVCVVRQMKMELEVRAARAGRVSWVIGPADVDVGEGTLAAVVEEEDAAQTRETKL